VERHHAGVVVVHAVHGAGAEAVDQPEHAGLRIDFGAPDEGIVGKADAGEVRIEGAALQFARHAHDQQGHLFVALQQAMAFAVGQRLAAHAAGVDGADRVEERPQAFLERALVRAEHAVVLAGEGIAVGVLQQGAGAHDHGILPEIIQHLFEQRNLVGRELAVEDAFLRFVHAVEEGIRRMLFFADFPEAVADQEAVEDVGADVERVVGLELRAQLGAFALGDLARHEHAHRLAADEPGAEHAPAHLQHVFQRQVAVHERQDRFVARDHHVHELRLEFPAFGRGAAAFAQAFLRAPDHVVAVGLDVRGIRRHPPHHLREHRAGAHADEGLGAVPFQHQVDRRGMPKLRLDGQDVEPVGVAVDFQEELRGVAHRFHGVPRMSAAQQAEIGDRFEPVEIGARQPEEVAEHRVGAPVRGQVRQAIEEIVGAEAVGADDLVDLVQEHLEARLGLQPAFLAEALRHQALVPREAEIDQLAAVALGRLRVGRGQFPVLVDVFDVPDDIVARQDSGQRRIQLRQAGGVDRDVVFRHE